MVGTGGPVATFSVWDYVVFAGTILGAAGIGLFQAIRGRKDTSSAEFLLGGRQMTAVPVAMSLTASFMSGITVIGTPTEAYRFGAAFWLFGFSYAIMSVVSAEVFVPLFYRLGITSAYEYLEMRFSRPIRIIGTSMYIIQTVNKTCFLIFNHFFFTGLDLWGVLVSTGAVCIIYCTLGGLKAVIWTDVIQMVIMLVGFVAVIARGAVLQGGLTKIWEDAGRGGRLEAFDFDPDPLKRHTFWTIVVGGSVMWVSIYSINQSQVQRYISCKTLGHAKMSLYVNMVGLWVTVSLAMFSGLTMFSIYKNCDPLTNGDIGTYDQMLPYLVMDILADYPGIPGLFVAAAYSGTLSTVSSSINALVAVTVEDFILPQCKNLTERQVIWLNMGLSVFFGALCIGMAGVASVLGNVLQAALSIFGMISGPLLGLYLLGMLFRTSNSIGGLVGMIVGLVLTLWVGVGGLIFPPTDEKTNPLQVSTVGCNSTMGQNYTTAAPWTSAVTLTSQSDVRPPLADSWYSLSYLHFALLGTLTTMVSGLLVSAITGGCKQEHINPDLFVKMSDLVCFSCSKCGYLTYRYLDYVVFFNGLCLDPLQETDVTEKAATDFHLKAGNSTFKDVDSVSKDVEHATKL
uniref:Solute carrier family 5 member 8, like n=1 Tax=Cyclopterus lumpus TaxID=8103 RepID=A0A8C3A1S1_CYCLU